MPMVGGCIEKFSMLQWKIGRYYYVRVAIKDEYIFHINNGMNNLYISHILMYLLEQKLVFIKNVVKITGVQLIDMLIWWIDKLDQAQPLVSFFWSRRTFRVFQKSQRKHEYSAMGADALSKVATKMGYEMVFVKDCKRFAIDLACYVFLSLMKPNLQVSGVLPCYLLHLGCCSRHCKCRYKEHRSAGYTRAIIAHALSWFAYLTVQYLFVRYRYLHMLCLVLSAN